MLKSVLMNEIKLIELKLNVLKARVVSEEPKIKAHTSANLYGYLKGSENITPQDVDAVKITLKEPPR